MTTLKIEMDLDNTAFGDDHLDTSEVARVLHGVADRLNEGRTDGPIRDVNGNHIGTYAISEDDA